MGSPPPLTLLTPADAAKLRSHSTGIYGMEIYGTGIYRVRIWHGSPILKAARLCSTQQAVGGSGATGADATRKRLPPRCVQP